MSDEIQVTEAEARANYQKWKAILDGLKSPKINRKEQAIKLAKDLEPFTESILSAQKAYIEKGFEVVIETNSETGLITKWKLKNKYPKRSKTVGGIRNVGTPKTMTVNEFNSIVKNLGDGEFSSKDINEVLKKTVGGERKLQPTLGNILKGAHGISPIEKVPGTDKAGTLYRLVQQTN
jgi:hypothetical protein